MKTFTAATLLLAASLSAWAAPPDLTTSQDFERTGFFHLGPTGAKGWIYTAGNFMTTDARQILITEVETGSTAEGKLAVGDVILGIGDRPFTRDARKALGDAINQAETHGVLKLLRWRDRSTETVELPLRELGAYSDTAPWNCAKTERILADALKVIIESKDLGRFGATGLALLATGEEKYIAVVRDYLHQQKWASPDITYSVEKGGKQSWNCGFQNLLLTEYYLLTEDAYVLPAIREHAIKISMGQSNAGTWGHGWAWTSQNEGKLHGGLPGYGALNQAGLPCFLSLLLAKKCGIEHPEIDAAIGRARRFFTPFIDKGSIGYGFHRPGLEIHANGKNGMSGNGKNGLGAIAFRLLGDEKGTRFFSRLTASLYNSMEYGHSGNSYSYFWDPIGAHGGGPELVAAFLKELRWYYALTRKADGSFVNQPLGGHYGRGLLSPTAAQVLIATLPRRAIYLTGKEQQTSEWLSKAEVAETMASGQWRLADTNTVRADELIAQLGDWSPIARERIAIALGKKQGDFVPRLTKLLDDSSPEVRAGAGAALGYQGAKAAGAVPRLAVALTDTSDIVSMSAGYALARIGKPAGAAVPDFLRALQEEREKDLMRPRQQALAYSLGYASSRYAPLYFNGVLPQFPKGENPLAGIDRKLLYPALSTVLQDPSGRTRGSAGYAFQFFDREDTAAMAQEIYDAIKHVALNYRMMDDEVRAQGLDLFARLHIKEGLPLCFETMDLHRWGQVMRLPNRFKTLQAYAGNAKPYLPQLVEMRERWKSGEHRDRLEQTIKIIEEDQNPPPLISLHDLVDDRLNQDLASAESNKARVTRCRKLMAQRPDDYFYQAAGLRALVGLLDKPLAKKEIEAARNSPSEILRNAAENL